MVCLAAQDQPWTRAANGVGVVGRLQLATTLAATPARPRRRSALGGPVRLAVALLVAWGFVQWVSALQQTVGS